MHLYALPLIFALAGLAFYAVLAGADFGAGFWELTAGRGKGADEIRDHAHAGMAPVWEANHVWLIFVLTVVWTAYPAAFGSIASTLAIPLFVAGIGIVLRGGAYAMRAGAASLREQRAVDMLFSVSSILTPFALGTAIGGIASQRVPVGNATGSLVRSWLNPTSVTIGVLAVAAAAYTAAVFLRGLSIEDAAAPHDTQVAVVVAVLGGAVILFPSLALLFRLTLGGRLGDGDGEAPHVSPTRGRTRPTTRLALACLIAGIGFLTVADSGWSHAVGVTCLLAFVAFGYRSALPADA